MGNTLARMCGSTANAQLIGSSHPAEVAGLMADLSRSGAMCTASHAEALSLLLGSVARVLWSADPGTELWRHLHNSALCDGLRKYLRLESLDPGTPHIHLPSPLFIGKVQAAAAVCIVLLTLSDGASPADWRLPSAQAALLDVNRWALQTLGVVQLSIAGRYKRLA